MGDNELEHEVVLDRKCDQIEDYTGSAETRTADKLRLRAKIDCSLNKLIIEEIPIIFPRCSDLILSSSNSVTSEKVYDIQRFFDDYFTKYSPTSKKDEKPLEPRLKCCYPCCYVKLEGKRGINFPNWIEPENGAHIVKRLFIADVVWLFYMERMGILKIVAAILNDYAMKGEYPIPNNTQTSLAAEAMIEQIETGIASTVRRRNATYKRCLGWVSDEGRELKLDVKVNSEFDETFHRFIRLSLEYFKDRRLAQAIQGQVQTGKVSVATLTAIGDTIRLLKKSFDAFDYGRNFQNTLGGIIWIIGGLALIRDFRTDLEIAQQKDLPYEYIPAAYEKFVKDKPKYQPEGNRYSVYLECADNARSILLDIQALTVDDPHFRESGGELEIWLDYIEDKIEGYRAAYRSITEKRIDLGESSALGKGTGKIEIEQKVV